MDIILQRKRKANNYAEKFTNKPNNISMEQAKSYVPEDEHSEISRNSDKTQKERQAEK